MQASKLANGTKRLSPTSPEADKISKLSASVFDTDRSPALKALLSPSSSTPVQAAPRTPSNSGHSKPEVQLPESTPSAGIAGIISLHSANKPAGAVMPPPPAHASATMQIAYTRAWDDGHMAYYFYTDAQSYWELPQSHPGGEWVLIWDLSLDAPMYFHTGTQEESALDDAEGQHYSHLPTGEEEPQQGADGHGDDDGWAAEPLQEDAVWLEAWDDTYDTPYYVHVLSGTSQWEWPAGGYVVQYGSEDYDHWWSQGQRAFEFDGAGSQAQQAAPQHTPVESTHAAGGSSPGNVSRGDTPTSMTSADKFLMAEAFGSTAGGGADSKALPFRAGGQPAPPPGRTGRGGSQAAMQLRRQVRGQSKA